MTTGRLQTYVGLIIVGSHFGILLIVFLSPILFRVELDDVLKITVVIGPLFAGYSTAIIRYFARHIGKAAHRVQQVNFAFTVIALSLPIAFSLLVLYFFLGYALNILAVTADDLQKYIAAVEAAFGVFVGYVLEGLFGYPSTEAGRSESSGPSDI